MDDRLPTSLWLDAHFHRLTLNAIPYYVINRGSYAGGMVMVKILAPGQGCRLLQQQRDMDGEMGWMALFQGEITPESKADEAIARAVSRDPDLWVIEVENRSLDNPFEGKVF